MAKGRHSKPSGSKVQSKYRNCVDYWFSLINLSFSLVYPMIGLSADSDSLLAPVVVVSPLIHTAITLSRDQKTAVDIILDEGLFKVACYGKQSTAHLDENFAHIKGCRGNPKEVLEQYLNDSLAELTSAYDSLPKKMQDKIISELQKYWYFTEVDPESQGMNIKTPNFQDHIQSFLTEKNKIPNDVQVLAIAKDAISRTDLDIASITNKQKVDPSNPALKEQLATLMNRKQAALATVYNTLEYRQALANSLVTCIPISANKKMNDLNQEMQKAMGDLLTHTAYAVSDSGGQVNQGYEDIKDGKYIEGAKDIVRAIGGAVGGDFVGLTKETSEIQKAGDDFVSAADQVIGAYGEELLGIINPKSITKVDIGISIEAILTDISTKGSDKAKTRQPATMPIIEKPQKTSSGPPKDYSNVILAAVQKIQQEMPAVITYDQKLRSMQFQRDELAQARMKLLMKGRDTTGQDKQIAIWDRLINGQMQIRDYEKEIAFNEKLRTELLLKAAQTKDKDLAKYLNYVATNNLPDQICSDANNAKRVKEQLDKIPLLTVHVDVNPSVQAAAAKYFLKLPVETQNGIRNAVMPDLYQYPITTQSNILTTDSPAKTDNALGGSPSSPVVQKPPAVVTGATILRNQDPGNYRDTNTPLGGIDLSLVRVCGDIDRMGTHLMGIGLDTDSGLLWISANTNSNGAHGSVPISDILKDAIWLMHTQGDIANMAFSLDASSQSEWQSALRKTISSSPEDPSLKINVVRSVFVPQKPRYVGKYLKDTCLGSVCLKADMLLKSWNLGFNTDTKKPVNLGGRYRSLLEAFYKSTGGDTQQRVWFILEKAEVNGQSSAQTIDIHLKAKVMGTQWSGGCLSDTGEVSKEATDLADFITEHLEVLAEEYPAIADLQNVYRVLVMLEVLRSKGVVLESFNGVPPKSSQSDLIPGLACIYRFNSNERAIIGMIGGVDMNVSDKIHYNNTPRADTLQISKPVRLSRINLCRSRVIKALNENALDRVMSTVSEMRGSGNDVLLDYAISQALLRRRQFDESIVLLQSLLDRSKAAPIIPGESKAKWIRRIEDDLMNARVDFAAERRNLRNRNTIRYGSILAVLLTLTCVVVSKHSRRRSCLRQQGS